MEGTAEPFVKAKSAQAKSISTIRKHPDKYGVKHFIKFGDYNIGRDGDLFTIPRPTWAHQFIQMKVSLRGMNLQKLMFPLMAKK